MAARTADDRSYAFTGRFAWAGYVLGFALGGSFDGILLHQILQRHHLLSAVEGAAFRDLGVQVLADGLFHAAMSVIAAVGLWLLRRTRREFAAPSADRLPVANALTGDRGGDRICRSGGGRRPSGRSRSMRRRSAPTTPTRRFVSTTGAPSCGRGAT